MHKNKIFNKLQSTIGMYIEEKGLGTTVDTTILMMIREQLRINDNLDLSIVVSSLKHPVSNLFGNSLDDFHSNFFLPSPLHFTESCRPGLVYIELEDHISKRLSQLCV